MKLAVDHLGGVGRIPEARNMLGLLGFGADFGMATASWERAVARGSRAGADASAARGLHELRRPFLSYLEPEC